MRMSVHHEKNGPVPRGRFSLTTVAPRGTFTGAMFLQRRGVMATDTDVCLCVCHYATPHADHKPDDCQNCTFCDDCGKNIRNELWMIHRHPPQKRGRLTLFLVTPSKPV